jgi:hypothetical protein
MHGYGTYYVQEKYIIQNTKQTVSMLYVKSGRVYQTATQLSTSKAKPIRGVLAPHRHLHCSTAKMSSHNYMKLTDDLYSRNSPSFM